MMTPRVRWLLAAPLLVASAVVVQMRGEQPGSQPALSASEAMIATRDGARLYTQVYTPKAATAPFPLDGPSFVPPNWGRFVHWGDSAFDDSERSGRLTRALRP